MAVSARKKEVCKMRRLIYFGSSDFSLPGLRACIDAPGYEVVAVITTPPQRQGRGLELTPTVVARFCSDKQIPYFEYPKLDETALSQVRDLNPEVFVVASYGKMIPESFLSLAEHRFNIHPSLLPFYRGASPLNGPILAGDTKTGLSIADVTKSLDAGDIYYQEEYILSPSADSQMLGVILAEKSYLALRGLLENALLDKVTGVPQDSSLSSYAPKLKKEDGRLFFNIPAEKWGRIVRGLKPWPGAFIEIQSERVGIIAARPKQLDRTVDTGTIAEINEDSFVVQTPIDCVEIIEVKPAGKTNMSGADYARGRRWKVGMSLL